MPGTLAHFAINADDVLGTRRFYEAVLGWTFTPWGPPGFFHIRTADGSEPGVRGALQQRRDLRPGVPVTGYECTIAVPDVDEVAVAVEAHGGRILMAKTTIAGVGHLIFFEDPARNQAGAMTYDPAAD